MLSNLSIEVPAKKLFELFNFPVTNTFLLALFTGCLIFALFYLVFRKPKIVPRFLQNFLEWILETFFNFVNSITKNERKTEKIFPLAMTLFLLILGANLLEIIPGIGVFHIIRSPSSDLSFTLGLALFSMLTVNIYAFFTVGPLPYLGKFLNFKSPVKFFVGLLEGLSEITKIISLSFRLFGNLFAGEVLLIVVSFMITYLLPIPFLLLEILVGFIQALIFSSLIVVFYTVATEHV